MRRLMWALSACLVLLAGSLTTAPTVAAITAKLPQFLANCHPSHELMDDPIVHPGMPGMAHMHQFYGSTVTNANSTVAQLEAAPTTCDNTADTAAYWMPAVYRKGTEVRQLALTAYYRDTAAAHSRTVHTIPQGLKMLAGNSTATGPQDINIAAWSCRQPSGDKVTYFSRPPMCVTGTMLIMKVWFPDCWDGVHLDSADHKSHLAYSKPQGVCPAGTPVNIPQLVMTVRLDAPTVPGPEAADGTAGYIDKAITLASGSAYTLHADFWNTWHQSALNQLVQYCMIQGHTCT